MITYSELIQTGIFIVALIGRVPLAFPFCISNIAHLVEESKQKHEFRFSGTRCYPLPILFSYQFLFFGLFVPLLCIYAIDFYGRLRKRVALG